MFIIKGRQIEILLFLLKNRKTTYKELAEKFEVSKKTIERDINSLSFIGVPVFCVQGGGGGVYIDEKYKFSKTFFSNEDIQNIIYALTTFDTITGKNNKRDILMKLCLIAPQLTNMIEEDARNYFIADLVDDDVKLEDKISNIINYALDEEVYINLYLEDGILKVAPISYILKRDGIYLYCYNGEYWLIKTRDIKECRVTKEEFIRDFEDYSKNKKYKG